jgi:hypothetical protein
MSIVCGAALNDSSLHVQILTDPFAYESYRQQRIQKKLEEERKSRISLVRKLPKVCF